MWNAHPYRTFIGWVQASLIRGTLTLLPLVITVAVSRYFFGVVNRWLQPLKAILPASFSCVPYSEVLLVVAVIIVMGGVIPLLGIGKLVVHLEHVVLKRIPLVNHIYFGIKQLTNAWRPENKMTFKHVVLVQFPRMGCYSIGFLTNEVSSAMAPEKGIRFLSVFIPTTPNPTTGFYLLVPEHECQILDISRQEAMTIIISGGIIQPERFHAP